MTGYVSCIARFLDGTTMMFRASSQNADKLYHFAGIFDGNDRPARNYAEFMVSAGEPYGPLETLEPSDHGFLLVDFQERRILQVRPEPTPIGEFLPAVAASSDFIKYCAFIERVTIHTRGKAVPLTPDIFGEMARYLDGHSSKRTLGKLTWLDWLMADVRVDFSGWDVPRLTHTKEGLEVLLAHATRFGERFTLDMTRWRWADQAEAA